MARYVAACKAADLIEGKGLSIEVDGLRVAVFLDRGRFHALLGHCPHAGGPIGLGWVEDGEVVCPLHRWRFKLETGRCTTVSGESVHAFRCEMRGDDLWVEV